MAENVTPKVKSKTVPALVKNILEATLELIPFVSSLRCCKEAKELKNNPRARIIKYAEAALWGSLDAITLATLAFPALGISLELGLMGSKGVRSAEKFAFLVSAVSPLFERIPQALAVANTMQNVYPFFKRAAPYAKIAARDVKEYLDTKVEKQRHSTDRNEQNPAVEVELQETVMPKRGRTKFHNYNVILLKKLPRDIKRTVKSAAREISRYIKPIRTMAPQNLFKSRISPNI